MASNMVAIIDYGVGNLLSVQRGLEYCGANVVITSRPEILLSAKRVVLPGVGAFDTAMTAIRKLNLDAVIHELVLRNIPLLGICLGMQLFFEQSDEFVITKGLGLIPGEVTAIPKNSKQGTKLKLPHIGWGSLQKPSEIDWKNTYLENNNNNDEVYFAHSYIAKPRNPLDCIAVSIYGGYKFTAMVAKNNVIGCQFHPEKSGEVGLKILKRFCID